MPRPLNLNGAAIARQEVWPAAEHRQPRAPMPPSRSARGLCSIAAPRYGYGVTAITPELEDAEHWAPGCGKGVRLSVDQEIEARFLRAERIAIEFPAFNDGRGLSLAVLLRRRHRYAGDIMATGDVQEDMLHYLRRCGFTSFLMPDERSLANALSTSAPHSDYYQASVIEPEPAFRRRGRVG